MRPIRPRSLFRPQGPVKLNRSCPHVAGLIGCWAFHLAGGRKLVEISGRARDGAFTNEASWVPGMEGGWAVKFDGTNDSISGTGCPLDQAAQATVAFWMRTTAASDSKYIVSLPLVSSGSNGVDFRTATTTLRTIVTSNTSQVDVGDSTAFADGAWHHVCTTYDNSNVRFFRNGVEKGSAALNGAVNIQNDGEFNFGRFGSFGAYWDGQLADVRIWNRALSAAEVRSLWHPATRWDLYQPRRTRGYQLPAAPASGPPLGSLALLGVGR